MQRLYEFVDEIETAKRLFNMQLRDVAVVEDVSIIQLQFKYFISYAATFRESCKHLIFQAYVKFGQGVREVQDEVSFLMFFFLWFVPQSTSQSEYMPFPE